MGVICPASFVKLRGAKERLEDRIALGVVMSTGAPQAATGRGQGGRPVGGCVGRQREPGPAPCPLPTPPSRELGQTMPMGAAGEAPRVCTGHPGMWRDRPWGSLSQDLQALGQEGEGPLSAGGPGPAGRWHKASGGPSGKRLRVVGFGPQLGAQPGCWGSVQSQGSAQVRASSLTLWLTCCPLVHSPLARRWLHPARPGHGGEMNFLFDIHSCASPKMSLLGEGNHY